MTVDVVLAGIDDYTGGTLRPQRLGGRADGEVASGLLQNRGSAAKHGPTPSTVSPYLDSRGRGEPMPLLHSVHPGNV